MSSRKDDLIKSMNYCIECAKMRIQWYMETGTMRYLNEGSDYLSVANLYVKEINNELRGNYHMNLSHEKDGEFV